MLKNKGLLIVISGPSGVGKDTVISELLKFDKNTTKSISVTTRPPRENEVNGIDYFFVSKKEFYDKISHNDFMEYANYCGNYYGTLIEHVNKLRNDGKNVILKIEVNGAKQIKKKYEDIVRIFIAPPSIDILKERLLGRGTENKNSIEDRLKKAQDEMTCAVDYDYIVVNDEVKNCIEDILSIIRAENLRPFRLINKIKK